MKFKNTWFLCAFLFVALIPSWVSANIPENSRQGSEDIFPVFRPGSAAGEREQHPVSRDVSEKTTSRSGACDEKDLGHWLDRFDVGRSFGFAHDPWHWGRHHGRKLTPYLYAGRRYSGLTGQYFNRNRYYQPKYGRFTSSDPIGFNGDLNLYRYANNNPLRWWDSFGLSREDILQAAEYLQSSCVPVYQLLGAALAADPETEAARTLVTIRDASLASLKPEAKESAEKALSKLKTHFLEVAQKIGSGHAYKVHKGDFQKWGINIKNKTDLQNLVYKLITNVSKRNFANFKEYKTKFWDEISGVGVLVIYDPRDNYGDDGTTFPPDEGKAYYDSLK